MKKINFLTIFDKSHIKAKVIVLLFLIVSILCSITFSQEKFIIKFDSLMTQEEQTRTGISKLTKPEREELEKWLTAFMIKLFSSENAEKSFTEIGTRRWIKEKIDGGRYLLLDDNSLWEISSMSKLNTFLWMPMEDVYIIKNGNNSLYPYKLINEDSDETADAKLISK